MTVENNYINFHNNLFLPWQYNIVVCRFHHFYGSLQIVCAIQTSNKWNHIITVNLLQQFQILTKIFLKFHKKFGINVVLDFNISHDSSNNDCTPVPSITAYKLQAITHSTWLHPVASKSLTVHAIPTGWTVLLFNSRTLYDNNVSNDLIYH